MIKCPNCGKSYYQERYSTCTAVYYPPIWKDGININPNGNVTTTNCTCCECHHDFVYQTRYGEIISIEDQGEQPQARIINMVF